MTRQLAADTGETVNLAVRSEESALYLDQVAGSSALQSHNWLGQRIPLHATSNGKVLLSELSEEELAAAPPDLAALHRAHDHLAQPPCARISTAYAGSGSRWPSTSSRTG